jgi:rhamnosyltransferase subunit B
VHFLLSTFGSAGDVFPILGLALALKERGHDATIATNPHFEALIQKHGVAFEPTGTIEEYDACIRHPHLWDPVKAFGHIANTLKPVLRRQYDIFAAHAAREDTIGLVNVYGFGALNAREKLGMKVITLHLQPAAFWSDVDPPTLPNLFGPRWLKGLLYRVGCKWVIDPTILPFLNEWRKELGLGPVKSITQWWNSPDGVLGMFPDWFAQPQRDWPPKVVLTDFPLWNDNAKAPLDAELESFLIAGAPPIAFTPGSANVHGEAFFIASVEACERMRKRGLLLTGYAEQVPRNLPPTVQHVRYAPLDLLLPRCAAFVHHGGIGSMSQAMLAGIPQLIMPLAHDQFDNAARVKKLGVGDWLSVKQFKAPAVADKLQKLLDHATTASACKQIETRLAPREGLGRSVEALEQMARG